MRFPWDERQLADDEVPSLTSGQNEKGHKSTSTHTLTSTHCKKTGAIDKIKPLSGYWFHTLIPIKSLWKAMRLESSHTVCVHKVE